MQYKKEITTFKFIIKKLRISLLAKVGIFSFTYFIYNWYICVQTWMSVAIFGIDSPIMNGARPSVMRFGFMFINILLKLFFLISIFIFENH